MQRASIFTFSAVARILLFSVYCWESLGLFNVRMFCMPVRLPSPARTEITVVRPRSGEGADEESASDQDVDMEDEASNCSDLNLIRIVRCNYLTYTVQHESIVI